MTLTIVYPTLESYVNGQAVYDRVARTLFDAHTILYAIADNTPLPLTVTEQTLVGRLTGGNISAVAIGISDDNIAQVDGTPNANEYTRFTANGVEGRTEAEFKADFNLEIGTDVLAPNGDGSALTGIDYSVVSGNDASTDVTGAQLEELTDGSVTSLHTHTLLPGIYAQNDEPVLGADDTWAFWKDTDDSNRVYLVYRRGSGDQVKVELT